MTLNEIKQWAIQFGINPGHCPKCKAELVVSNRIPFAKSVGFGIPISFDCPNSSRHIETLDLEVYFVTRNCRADSAIANP